MKKIILFTLAVFLNSQFSTLNSVAFAQTIREVKGDFSVSALIPPRASDFQFQFTSDTGHRIPQGHTLNYEITYGASSSATLNTTTIIVVDFNNDKAPDGTHVVDYVFGSATTGYNNVQPVVDIKNRTITWTIPTMPAGTVDQKLMFQLRTNANYTQEKIVNLIVNAHMRNQYVTLPLQTLTHEYLFDVGKVTPGPTQPQPTANPTIPVHTPSPIPLRIQNISFNTISANQIGITVKTNRPAKLMVRYGTSPNALTQTIQTDDFSVNSPVALTKLKPDTPYFFKITATDASRKTAPSELFAFTTARESQLPELRNDAVVITSKEAVVLSDILNATNLPFGIMTSETDYVFTYTFSKLIPIAKMEAVVKDINGTDVQTVTMNTTSERVYTAHLRTGQATGYHVFVRVTDNNGNMFEQKAANIKVIHPFQVLEEGSALPIGDARVLIKFYNEHTQQYELVSKERFGTHVNPAFTPSNGELDLLLPEGSYQAEISAIGYDAETVTFALGQDNGQSYPTVYLNKNITNITALFQFMQDWQADTISYIQTSMLELFASIRFFNSVAFTTLLSFINLGFLMFGLRTGISIRDVAPFFLFHLFVATHKHKGAYIYGMIVDHQNNPVSQAVIEVLDLKTSVVLTHTISNKAGTFSLKNTFKQQYVKLIVGKEGYPEIERIIPTITDAPVKIGLHLHKEGQKAIQRGFQHTVGELFEITLLLCLIAELLFIATFGVAKTLPFIILSVFNLMLWIFFQREKRLS